MRSLSRSPHSLPSPPTPPLRPKPLAPSTIPSSDIAASDGAFFDAYNNCQLETMKSFITSDVEF
jgi:hypothetical protein